MTSKPRMWLIVNGRRHRVTEDNLLRRTAELSKKGRVDLQVEHNALNAAEAEESRNA